MYNPLNIPDFSAGTFKGMPKKRRFLKLELNAFHETEAIVCHYTEWVIAPDGDSIFEQDKTYVRPIGNLITWFNTTLPEGVTIGQAILGAINTELNGIID